MIRAVQPDVVVVELCQYRVSMLKMDENTLLKEAKDINLDKVQQAIKQVRLSKWLEFSESGRKKTRRKVMVLFWNQFICKQLLSYDEEHQ